MNKENKQPLAILHANALGECYQVFTKRGSEQCGIAPIIVFECFIDKEVTKMQGNKDTPGGVNPLKSKEFQGNPILKTLAIRYCRKLIHVIFKSCREDKIQDANPPTNAEYYLEKGIISNYNILISFNQKCQSRPVVMKTMDAYNEYIKDSEKFVNSYGTNWFYCKTQNTYRK